MSADSALIDRIVHGVLTQLAGSEGVRTSAKPRASQEVVGETEVAAPAMRAEFVERIVTAELLSSRANRGTRIVVGSGSIVTPAAWDLIRERGLTVERRDAQPQSTTAGTAGAAGLLPLIIVVRNTTAVDRLHDDLKGSWRRELLGCPDDAARLAISAVTRGEANTIVILAAQTYRAACLANRNEAVKAVAVRDAADVPVVRKQLRANVWCVDPSDRSWFELRNLARAIGRL